MQPVPIALGEFTLSRERVDMGAVLPPAEKEESLHFSGLADERKSGKIRDDSQGITLAFQHLNVVLAIAARNVAKLGGMAMPSVLYDVLADDSNDPVVVRLSDALRTTQAMESGDAGIQADALRLAIVARMVGLHFNSGYPDEENIEAGAPCRPSRALQRWRLKRVLEYIDSHLTDKISLQDIAAAAGLSRMHFESQFRAATGMRPHDYLLRQRIRRAEHLLSQTDLSLAEIALTVGFRTQAHFTSVFKRFMNNTPYQWRSARRLNGVAEK